MRFFLLFSLNLLVCDISAQVLKGCITSNGNQLVPFANIVIEELNIGVSADKKGCYELDCVTDGDYNVTVSAVGMQLTNQLFSVKKGVNLLNIDMLPSVYDLDDVVITGERSPKRKTDSPIIVNIINSAQLENVQACNLSEGLNFQPGLRVEIDCQTCNYSQLRINGLAGGYSQILINGRSIFSSLVALYGLEQLPVNMIDRVEIVRGGGSALYGSSAIAGVVNIITKLPLKNNYNIGYDYRQINRASNDHVFRGNMSFVNSNKDAGMVFFFNNRKRAWYDHNEDNFSELPKLHDMSFGSNFYFMPTKNQKIEFNVSKLNEYRYGGEMVDGLAHFSLQAEERYHDVLLANLDYQLNSKNGNSSFIAYLAFQDAKRDHYTGIRPELNTFSDTLHLIDPPYGKSSNRTGQAGFQLSNKLSFLGSNILTIGGDFLDDNVSDKIEVYNYLVDQKVNTLGLFLQSDWSFSDNFNVLSSVRFDNHSMLNSIVLSPRFSLLYKFNEEVQFRSTYSTGFRAPQAFDSDLHMAFAGGGVSTIDLADDLIEENSNSLSFSINYDRLNKTYLFGFTLEAFLTSLDNVFYYEFIGQNDFGEQLLKRNGKGAVVHGVNIESRLNYVNIFRVESGYTFQKSEHVSPILYSSDLLPKKDFLRSPDSYGYAAMSYFLNKSLSFNANLVYTGKMHLIHLAGSPEQEVNEYFISEPFTVIGLRASYVISLDAHEGEVKVSFGVKNLTNAYQDNFDTTKNRDSNFIYGPALPRTLYLGLNWSLK